MHRLLASQELYVYVCLLRGGANFFRFLSKSSTSTGGVLRPEVTNKVLRHLATSCLQVRTLLRARQRAM